MALSKQALKAETAIREAMLCVRDNIADGKYKTAAYQKLEEALLLLHANDII